ncbi:preprotein translocase subunit YajC [Rhodococcus sp. H29-C3]|uniref:preprotein translocase subunit YajC n=1 Tax=Rhodococcus sp. H29-C3 TaxID=3046307 RepID=UPI0024BB44EF|nr:preprotein translocase subunit YajC [Rhodococcus sp. H29-C3]MDJ0361566.1 preprotein translocase subunit YajC [Rhodococcus sp. H29-C3]
MELLFPLLIVALLVPMFLNVRRQKKALAQTQTLQDSLKVGDEVVTTAGLYARVVLVEDDTVDLEIADGIVTTWSRAVVKEVLPPDSDDLDSDFAGSADVIESDDATPSLEKSTTLDKDASPSSSEETVEQSARRLEKE